ncbi:MAG: DUF58 domain-containing protein [Rubellimicrobium sp.]|nr:DUF58 domain-containing protein [Rubellimicrobium sp.]
MSDPAALRGGAEALAAPLPPLLVEAQRLAATVIMGEHGRRRPGHGTGFWQYRAALPGDPARTIDWRRSAKSDATFVQEKEWQAAQTLLIHADGSAAMRFASSPAYPAKGERAALLTLALAVLAAQGGERVGLLPAHHPPRRGTAHLVQMARDLAAADEADFGTLDAGDLPPHGRAVFLSDFMGDLAALEAALALAAAREVRGALVQVLDPAEETFPFTGRTIFESMTRRLRHETLDAGELRSRYLARLAERKARLGELAQAAGWQVVTHHTDTPAAPALLWLWGALSMREVA